MTKTRDNPKHLAWIAARKRHHLSHAHVQMARELGMNPAKLGAIDDHTQKPWKLPLPAFIEHLYEKRFGISRPNEVMTLEEMARASAIKDAERKAKKQARRLARSTAAPQPEPEAIKEPSSSSSGDSRNVEPTGLE